MVRVLGLDHVVLRVRDVERSIRFYTDVLGCTEERRIEPLGLYQLRAGSALIDLVALEGPIGREGGPAPDLAGRNVDHFALRVDGWDDAALASKLAEHGLPPPGESGRRYGAEGFGPSVYIRDPDDNVVELKGPPEAD